MFAYLFGARGRIDRLEFLVLLPFSLGGALVGASVWYGQFGDLPSAIQDLGWEALVPTLIFPQEHRIATAAIFLLFLAWCVLARAYGVKRLHDLDRRGWWLLVFIPPVALFLNAVFSELAELTQKLVAYGLLAASLVPALCLMAEMFLRPGTKGDNRFGPGRVAQPEMTPLKTEIPVD
jgi:uncharacterized membrane protein YhaH (DUF805 family)